MSDAPSGRVAAAAVAGFLVGLSVAGCGSGGIEALADMDVVRATEPADSNAVQPSSSAGSKMSCTPEMMGSVSGHPAGSAAPAGSGSKMSCSAEMMGPKQ